MRAELGDNVIPIRSLRSNLHAADGRKAVIAGIVRVQLHRAVLLVILLAAGALRWEGLTRESRHGDEYMQTSVYRSSSIRSVIHVARTHSQPPLDYLLGWGICRITDSVAAMRLPAATFGVASVLMTYALASRLASRRAALLAAALLAVSPLHLRMSATARPYTIFVFAWLLTLWSMHVYLSGPMLRRLVFFGICGYATAWTNGLGPYVGLAATSAVVGGMWLVRRWRQGETDVERAALRRATLATLVGGCLAVPLLLYLLTGSLEWTAAGGDAMAETVIRDSSPMLQRLLAAAACWGAAWPVAFGAWGYGVLMLAFVGVVVVARRWTQQPAATRTVWASSAAAGVLFLPVFAIVVKNAPMRDRYGLFLLPTLAAAAAVGAEFVASRLAARATNRAVVTSFVFAALLIAPAWAALQERERYTNCDWQGCAAALLGQVTAEDVIVVIEDRPLGEYQPPFWGKHDWPKDAPRPLAEAAWTLVTSPTHWQRLTRQTGRPFLVLARQVDGERCDDYLQSGLRVAPPGWTLRKFRGLDLLIRGDGSLNGSSGVAEACRIAAQLPLKNPDIAAIPLILRAKLLDALGQSEAAQAARDAAWAAVPVDRRAWFARLTGLYSTERFAR